MWGPFSHKKWLKMIRPYWPNRSLVRSMIRPLGWYLSRYKKLLSLTRIMWYLTTTVWLKRSGNPYSYQSSNNKTPTAQVSPTPYTSHRPWLGLLLFYSPNPVSTTSWTCFIGSKKCSTTKSAEGMEAISATKAQLWVDLVFTIPQL
jgi:hypothetical protein